MSDNDHYHDDPLNSEAPKSKWSIFRVSALITAIVVGAFYIQGTLASNISLNSGSVGEFGQGVTRTIACDSDGITLTPEFIFENVQGGGSFKLARVLFSDIDTRVQGCANKTLTLGAFGDSEQGSLGSIVITVSATSNYFTFGAGAPVTLINPTSTGFTMLINEESRPAGVVKFTIESADIAP